MKKLRYWLYNGYVFVYRLTTFNALVKPDDSDRSMHDVKG